MNLESKLEALLFFKCEPMTKKKAETALECTREELENALISLTKTLAGTDASTNVGTDEDTTSTNRGLCIISNGDEIEMRTAPEMSDFIMKMTKEELARDLGRAGLETLTIILYKHPIKRSEIDYIRGVNSSFILRNLLIRGLIERLTEREDILGQGRGFLYKPTIDLLAHLGVSKIEDLPEYATVKAEFDNFATEEERAETKEKSENNES
ncbi:MAG: SMC-Scp complex subunit ScpB [bacterium]|nr:SMC-Scp complex subunit ScpB [bacterium]